MLLCRGWLIWFQEPDDKPFKVCLLVAVPEAPNRCVPNTTISVGISYSSTIQGKTRWGSLKNTMCCEKLTDQNSGEGGKLEASLAIGIAVPLFKLDFDTQWSSVAQIAPFFSDMYHLFWFPPQLLGRYGQISLSKDEGLLLDLLSFGPWWVCMHM